MLYFALGVIAGLLVNPFRSHAAKAIAASKSAINPPHASFVEPKDDHTSITSLKDYIHD